MKILEFIIPGVLLKGFIYNINLKLLVGFQPSIDKEILHLRN